VEIIKNGRPGLRMAVYGYMPNPVSAG